MNKKSPAQLARFIKRHMKLRRFVVIGESHDNKVLIFSWNGKEFNNSVDMLGLTQTGLINFLSAQVGLGLRESDDAKAEIVKWYRAWSRARIQLKRLRKRLRESGC